jgi:outer membrane protein
MIHTSRLAIVVLSLLSIAFQGYSQNGKQPFTLKSSIEYSLKNNPTSTIYNNQAEISRFNNRLALASYLPQINGNVTADFNAKLPTTIMPAGVFGNPEEIRLSLGNKHQNGAVVQLDQKIFDMSSAYSLTAMKRNSELAQLQILKNNEDLVYQTATAYYQVLIIGQQQKLLEENEKQYADLLRILKLKYDKGVIKKMEYDRTRVAYNNITSQLVLLETNKKLALNSLKVSIGMPMSENITIEEEVEVEMDVAPPVTNTADVSKRLDFLIQDQNILLKEIHIKTMKVAGLPSLTAYARYGANAYGNDVAQSFEKWFDYSAIGVKLTVPIFNGLSVYSNYRIGQLDLMNMKESAKLNVQNFLLESENANTQLFSSYTSLINNKENMQLAKEVHEASNLEYKEGTSSLTDLLNSDYSYKEAQSNYINSLLNYLTSKMQYEKSKGTLTDYVNQLK